MKEQSDDKAKATTTIKSTPVQQSKPTVQQGKPTKDELSEQELDKATGGVFVIRAKQNNVGPTHLDKG